MDKYREMLENLRFATESKIKDLRKSEFQIMADEIDQVQEHEREELRQRMLTRESMLLNQIHTALKMVDKGTYGNCEDCECTITMNRLKARPTATRCVDCQADYEES